MKLDPDKFFIQTAGNHRWAYYDQSTFGSQYSTAKGSLFYVSIKKTTNLGWACTINPTVNIPGGNYPDFYLERWNKKKFIKEVENALRVNSNAKQRVLIGILTGK